MFTRPVDRDSILLSVFSRPRVLALLTILGRYRVVTLGDARHHLTISQVVPFPFSPSTPIVREYQQRMGEIGVTDYDFSSMEGYLAARVLTEGLKRAGRTLNREGLIAALESLRDFNMGGFSVTYGPQNHQGSRFTDLTLISRSGRFVR